MLTAWGAKVCFEYPRHAYEETDLVGLCQRLNIVHERERVAFKVRRHLKSCVKTQFYFPNHCCCFVQQCDGLFQGIKHARKVVSFELLLRIF